MTCNELKAAIDNLIGIKSQRTETPFCERELHYLSPTGVLLFVIVIFSATPGVWRIGGYPGGVLPGLWSTLMKLQRGKEDNDE